MEKSMTRDDFKVAFDKAKKGDKIIYHIGRSINLNIGRYVFEFYERGEVILIQRRIDKLSVFEYIAKKV